MCRLEVQGVGFRVQGYKFDHTCQRPCSAALGAQGENRLSCLLLAMSTAVLAWLALLCMPPVGFNLLLLLLLLLYHSAAGAAKLLL